MIGPPSIGGRCYTAGRFEGVTMVHVLPCGGMGWASITQNHILHQVEARILKQGRIPISIEGTARFGKGKT